MTDRVEYVLKRVNLWDARRKFAGRYSGGMKRRLSVAIAIIAKPKVLYLDEPSTVRYDLKDSKYLGLGS